MSHFIIINRMKVKKANVLTSFYAITPTPIMACHLFSHAMARKIDVEDLGIAVIHHQSRLHSGNIEKTKVGLQIPRSATLIDSHDYVSGGIALPLQPVATADLEITLIIEVDGFPDHEEITEFMDCARLSGGVISGYRSIEVTRELIEGHYPTTGYWLIDRSDLLAGSTDMAKSMVECLSRIEKKRDEADSPDIEDTEQAQASFSFLCPIVPAYALTSMPSNETPGVRLLDDLSTPEHAFCEPMLGLGQYVSVRRYKGQLPFWRASWINESLYAIEQKSRQQTHLKQGLSA